MGMQSSKRPIVRSFVIGRVREAARGGGCRTTDQTRARMCLQDRLNVAQEEYRSQRVTLLDLVVVVLDDNREHRHLDLLQESHFH